MKQKKILLESNKTQMYLLLFCCKTTLINYIYTDESVWSSSLVT